MQGLHIYGVTHSYGSNKVLNGASLTIPAGELVCLLGPSGCGKSTILRLAGGLETLQEGNIVIDGETVANSDMCLPPERRKIGLMFQDYALFPHLDIMDNVTFGLHGMEKSKAERRALEMLEQVGMSQYVRAYPHMLSGGQQQRVALARALAPEPKLLLLDEPFSGLDTNMREKIRQETLSVLRDAGVATLMVTHDPEEAMYMADRIKILGRGGKILQAGSPNEIYYNPADEFVANLFGMMNKLEGIAKGGMVETPLGKVAYKDKNIRDGELVQVLVRPEGILFDNKPGENAVKVEVVSNHLLGHSSIVRMRVPDGSDKGLMLDGRVHREFTPELDNETWATVDPVNAFVFPLKSVEQNNEPQEQASPIAAQ
ncbi:ABC transporter ATP-binding protein [Terasakiella sp. SH-1]|uniref:ABC transporter ATP-binding protein n=1 Tax=Terasakiella sp. SH-1 TaxID=2560057 RepID=UPI0010740D3A|nr:ABC transporter ATP-binding protein [Terasakiella sp. SH-1]